MSLATAEQVRFYIPTLTGTSRDTELDILVTRVGEVFAELIGHPAVGQVEPTIEETTYRLFLDGPGGRFLRLPVRPIVTLSSVFDDPLLEYGTDTEVAIGDIAIDTEDGLLILKNTAATSAWSGPTGARRAVKVTVSAGYSSGNVPAAIQDAAAFAAAHWFNLTAQGGMTQISQEGVNLNLRAEHLPDKVREQLSTKRNFTSLLGF